MAWNGVTVTEAAAKSNPSPLEEVRDIQPGWFRIVENPLQMLGPSSVLYKYTNVPGILYKYLRLQIQYLDIACK